MPHNLYLPTSPFLYTSIMKWKTLMIITLSTILLIQTIFFPLFSAVSDTQESSILDKEYDPTLQAAPNEPTDPEPKNGSFGLGVNVTLSVYVSDPDSSSFDVTFYNASSGSAISAVTGAVNDTRVYANWTNLASTTTYRWNVTVDDGTNLTVSDTWEFSTSNVDTINITGEAGGKEIKDDVVPVEYTQWANCSAYNQTTGYLGTVEANWTAEGGNSSLKWNTSNYTRIDVGDVPGLVWFNASYAQTFNDSVRYEVNEPSVDRIHIVEKTSNGETVIGDRSIYINQTITGYTAGYNDSVGFLRYLSANWTVNSQDGAQASTAPQNGTNSTFDAGPATGSAVWNASTTDLGDEVNFTIDPPTLDYIQIRSEAGGEGEVLENMTYQIDETDEFYAAGYNKTHGYLRDISVDWATNSDAASLSPLSGNMTVFEAIEPGSGEVYAVYGSIQNSTSFTVIESQDPEIMGDIPDIQLSEDFGIHQVNLSSYASDPQDPLSSLQWYLTGVNESVVAVAGENQTGNHIITLISQNDQFGDMLVTYHLVDSDGYSAQQSSWINVSFVNDPPVFYTCPDLSVHYDDPYRFDYSPYIEDIDTPQEELSLTTDDPDHTSVNGLKVTYEYPEEMVGETVLVSLTVSDGDKSSTQLIEVNVTDNYPPENTERIPDVTLEENSTRRNVFDLDNYITDPDNDSLYMSYGATYINVTIYESNHTVDIVSRGNWNGMERVTFRATDPGGAIVEQTINVTVTPVNDPPKIKDLPPFVVHWEHPYTFDLRWYISDSDNEIEELDISTSDPENVTVEGTTLHMLYPKKSYEYTVPLTIYVSDGIDTTFEPTTVKVGDDYPPEVLKPLPDISFKEDESLENAFALDNYFHDRDSETIYYTSGNVKVEVHIHHDVEGTPADFSAEANWSGSELVTFRATDEEGALIEDTINVTVIPVNDPPVIEDIPHQKGYVDESWVLDLDEYIYDIDNKKEELIVSVNDENVIQVGHKLIFDYSEDVKSDNITLIVSDGELQTRGSISVSVSVRDQGLWKDSYFFYLIPAIIGAAGASYVYYKKRREYTVDDIFLIHSSGVLIKHTTRMMKADRDEEILASMFTAVQNFVKDAFAEEEDESLKRMDYGDKKVLIHKGDYVTLAVFFSGNEPKWMMDSMENLVSDIEERYGEELEGWSGEVEEVGGITEMLKDLLKGRYQEGDWRKYEE